MNVVREEESINFSLTGVDETFGLRGNQQQPVCDPLLPGVDVGGATLLRRIASGGMGVVFEAHKHAPSRRVAVKFLNRYEFTFAHRLLAEEDVLKWSIYALKFGAFSDAVRFEISYTFF